MDFDHLIYKFVKFKQIKGIVVTKRHNISIIFRLKMLADLIYLLYT